MYVVDPSGVTESMPPFPMKRSDVGRPFHEYMVRAGYGLIAPLPKMKVFMFDNIKRGDKVQVWLPVTEVDGDSITVAGHVTLGRESVVGHKPKDSPDMVWAALTEEQKRELIERLQR